MAQFGYQSQSRDLLVFGQAIQVGEQSVRVERHLSQGGFAHVYLVRTDKPVGGTTQHVLKHIRVAQESMLNEVRKEVDIMRLLRGHPNIVHLIDAAWSKQPNGIFEVFILMEFCAGGGIIDMMNRRLRERLTEAEILQIFVDVCEGLALMHNLRPALLHRDLKVENILQSSATKYKLCDFGSATPVSARPPSTVAEVQALAHDLDRHTTLQYRAPEMIDPNLRRPIDEKSDVWALGVLLYKLCYYTTPFEEHGPLAILNVQYSFPQYPVYSAQMNALIRSMLQEYGTYRPSVYDLLTTVHAMRGTRSQYSYNRPPAPAIAPGPPPVSSLDDILVKRKQQAAANQPAAGGAAAARQQVLDAIAPMRRGRPETQDERAWETAKADAAQGTSAPSRDAWEINLKRVEAKSPAVVSPTAGNSFADSFKPSILNAHVPPPIKSPLNTAYQQSPASKSISPPSLAGLTSAPAAILRAPSAPLQTPRLPPSSVSPGPSAVRSPPLDDSSLSAEERFPSLEALDAAFSDSGSAAAPPASRPGPGASEPSFQGSLPKLSVGHNLHLHGARSTQVTGIAMRNDKEPKPPAPAPIPHAPAVSSSPPTSPRPMLRRHRSSVAIKSPVVARQSVVQQHENIVGPALAPNLPPRPVPVPAPQQDWLTGEFDEPHMAQAPAFGRTGKSSLEGPRAMGSRPASMSASMSAKPLSTERMSSPKPPLPPRRPASPVDILEEAKNRFKPPSPIPGSSFDFSRSKLEATKLEPLRLSPALRRASPKPTGLTDNWSPVEAKHPHRRSSTGSSSSEDEPPEDISQGRRSVLAPKARKTKIRPKGKSGSIHDLVDLWSPGANDSSSTATKGLELPAASTGHYQRPSSGGRSDMGSRLERSPSSQAQKWNADPSPILQPSAVPPASSPAKTRPQSMFLYGSNSGGTPSHSPSTLPQVQQQYQQQQANKYSALHHQTSYTSGGNSLAAPPQDASRARATRRGSISDMVDKYEALASPRSPVAPRWSPGGAATSIALPGLAAPGHVQPGRVSPGLSAPPSRRTSNNGRVSPAASAAGASTAPTSAFYGRQPVRQSTMPAPSPTKATMAPASPTKATFGIPRSTTGSKPLSSVVGPGAKALPGLATSITPKPLASMATPKPATSNTTDVRTTLTGAGSSYSMSGHLPRTVTGSGGMRSLTPVSSSTSGAPVKPSTTGAASPALRSPTGLGHGRQASTSVLYNSSTGMSPALNFPLMAPIPLKPSSLSKRAPPSGAPGLKSITPPRELNGGSSTPSAGASTSQIASPTPDRAYTGVSKLIDQWQKKTEDVQTSASRTGSFKSKG